MQLGLHAVGSVWGDPLLTGITMSGSKTTIVADARALHMRLRVRRLHLAGIVRLRGLAVVTLHRVLLCVAHGGVVHAGRTNRVGSGAAGLGLCAGNRHRGNAEHELKFKLQVNVGECM